MASNFTCKGCENRHSGCHSECEKYKAEKAAWEEMMAKHRKNARIQQGLDFQKIGHIVKAKKRRRDITSSRGE